MESSTSDTHSKALRINLDPLIYGTIAEIGAGQETARWFFQVGGAAGTVAKSMSAYDMQFSDEIYGQSERYVSRDRLEKMLEREYTLLVKRLGAARGANTAFFVFANTVSARDYHGTNICHGWLGVRFQTEPGAAPNTISLHVNLNDPTNRRQQQALGILGVNLIYAACYQRQAIEELLDGLLDGLSIQRLEVDFIDLSGPAFDGVDNRLVGLQLLRHGLALAVLYSHGGAIDEPMAMLYKRPAVIERGAFRIEKSVYGEMLAAGMTHLAQEGLAMKRPPAALFEISVKNLLAKRFADDAELLQRIDRLLAPGRCVLVTAFPQTYHLTEYLRRYTGEPLRFCLGISSLVYLFDEDYYQDLNGGILEAFGRLIERNVRLYIFPMPAQRLRERLGTSQFDVYAWDIPADGPARLSNVAPRSALKHLYAYLQETGVVMEMEE